ncbi:MAG: cytochrome c-type biogenesis protein CcmH [Candidatus Polarisedimenticolaceae bacterium]|nr:cytochrome c-type biogenesis protein CcmH [Candidatus Polarisedimenticolaceae bacterium]
MKTIFFALFLLFTGWSTSSFATLADYHFESEERSEEFRELTEELRCMVCQNQSLAGSDAELAQDLRREVYNMIKQGQTKDDVIEFMVSRYGDFVLYEPPLKPSTYPLWFGPFFILAIGGLLLGRTLMKKKRSREVELTDADQEKLAKLLNTSENQDS